jgi:HPt (histidine-containing phosphotransfer) domain-containing protein
MLFAIAESDTLSGPASASDVDRIAILERMNGDEALVSDVIRLFLDDCPARLRAIKAAVDARDGEAIRLEAHGLKGAAGNLSATGLFDAAQILERIGAEARLDAAEAAWRLLSIEAIQALDTLREFETRGLRQPVAERADVPLPG